MSKPLTKELCASCEPFKRADRRTASAILSHMAPNFSQSSSQFLASIDAAIQRLQDLREQVAAAVDADHAITQTAKVVRRGMSEEGRRKIAAAQKARWAKQKKANKSAAKAPAQKAAVKQIAKKATAKKSTVKKSVSKKAAAVKTTEQA